jgi:hypothetical protein
VGGLSKGQKHGHVADLYPFGRQMAFLQILVLRPRRERCENDRFHGGLL